MESRCKWVYAYMIIGWRSSMVLYLHGDGWMGI